VNLLHSQKHRLAPSRQYERRVPGEAVQLATPFPSGLLSSRVFIGIDLLRFQLSSYSALDKIDVGVYIVTTT
jgi:hypothetical protein